MPSIYDYQPNQGGYGGEYTAYMNRLNQQPQPSYAPWQSVQKPYGQPAQQAGAGPPRGNLWDYLNYTPATPQYAGGLSPSLPQYSAPRETQAVPMPQLQGQLQNPSLDAPMSLENLLQGLSGYQAADWGMFDAGDRTPVQFDPRAYGQQGGGQNDRQIGVSAGISIPQGPGMPHADPLGSVSGLGAMGQQAQGQMGAAQLGPQMMGQQQEYYQNAADLLNQGQKARSDSGLGWGNMAELINSLYGTKQVNQQNNLLGFLSGMTGGM